MDISEFKDHSGTLRAYLLLLYANSMALFMVEHCLWVDSNVGKRRSGLSLGATISYNHP